MNDRVTIEVRQHDWIPGWAAFLPNEKGPQGEAQVVINIGGMMACVDNASLNPADIPYLVAESLMHEVVHVIEQWAGVEFSEERVEVLLAKYRAEAHPDWAQADIDPTGIEEQLHQMLSDEPDEEKQAVLAAAMALIAEHKDCTA